MMKTKTKIKTTSPFFAYVEMLEVHIIPGQRERHYYHLKKYKNQCDIEGTIIHKGRITQTSFEKMKNAVAFKPIGYISRSRKNEARTEYLSREFNSYSEAAFCSLGTEQVKIYFSLNN